MQGRLSPKPVDRIQAFPKDHWREEFSHAQQLGFDCIELIYDELYLEQNPLQSAQGREEICVLSKRHQIEVSSICADYFMPHPLERNLELAVVLLDIAKAVNCPLVEFPFVHSSSLRSHKNKNELIEAIMVLSKTAKIKDIKIALETDLPPDDFK